MYRRIVAAAAIAICLAFVIARAWSQQPQHSPCYPDPNPLAGRYYFHPADIQQMTASDGRLFVLVRERSGRASLWEYSWWGTSKPTWKHISTARPKAEEE